LAINFPTNPAVGQIFVDPSSGNTYVCTEPGTTPGGGGARTPAQWVGSGRNTDINSTFLKLDASNSPLTGELLMDGGFRSNGTGADKVQAGTTSERPLGLGPNDAGYTRFNTTTRSLEQWTGTDWTVAFDIQDGSFTNNVITWRNEGEIDSWTTPDAGPVPTLGSKGSYTNCVVSGGSGTGAIVACDYDNTTLSNFRVQNPGTGYNNGETITVTLQGTDTVTGTITVTTEDIEEGWAARPGSDYFVASNSDDLYYGRPTFREGVITGESASSGAMSDVELAGISMGTFPRAAKTSNFRRHGSTLESKDTHIINSSSGNGKGSIETYSYGYPRPSEPYCRVDVGYGGETTSGDGTGDGYFRVYQYSNTGNATGYGLAFEIQYGYVIAPGILANTTTTDGANVNINVSTGALRLSTSSRRYKDNIRNYGVSNSEALDIISQIQPREWEDHESGETTFGFIAEEVYDIAGADFVKFAPWAKTTNVVVGEDKGGNEVTKTRVSYPRIGNGETPVTKDGEDLTDKSEVVDSVNERALIVALLKSVQELKAQNEALTARIEALEA